MFGVTFGDKHSYRDWKLIPKSRPVISPPAPKTNYISIPEADGSLDLTEGLSGEVKFEDRTITFEFVVIEARKRWSRIYSDIMNYLHGKRMKIVLDEDPKYYYLGRLQVNEWESDKKTSTITITGTVEPYKYDLWGSLDPWEWNPFNFEEDVIREYDDLEVYRSLEFTIVGSRKSVVPTFIVSSNGAGMQVTFEGVTYNLQDGSNRVVNIVIKDGEHTLVFTGMGTVSIDYRGGSL